jgi:adenine-specific DNA methylase
MVFAHWQKVMQNYAHWQKNMVFAHLQIWYNYAENLAEIWHKICQKIDTSKQFGRKLIQNFVQKHLNKSVGNS